MEKLSEHKLFSGMQLRFRHTSEVTESDMTFSIYLPKGHDEGKRFPALYWLSGLSCTDENFIQKAGAQRRASDLGMILVAPDTSPRGPGIPDDNEYDLGMGAGFYVNATQAPWATHYKMYDYVTLELPKLIETHFPITDKKAISGHSMGGHGALMIGLRNPKAYTSISAFSPIINPSEAPWGQKAFKAYLGNNKTDWMAYDSTELMKQTNTDIVLPILISQGDKDAFLESELKPDNFLTESHKQHYPIDYQVQKGYDHSYFFIATFIEEHLLFHKKYLTNSR